MIWYGKILIWDWIILKMQDRIDLTNVLEWVGRGYLDIIRICFGSEQVLSRSRRLFCLCFAYVSLMFERTMWAYTENYEIVYEIQFNKQILDEFWFSFPNGNSYVALHLIIFFLITKGSKYTAPQTNFEYQGLWLIVLSSLLVIPRDVA